MGLSWLILLVSAHCVLGATEYYESYTGATITEEEYNARVAGNTTFWCTNVIETCVEEEGRRLDGSCNNLNNPQRGTTHTPTYALLPKIFTGEDEPRLASSGSELPLAREIRTRILADGRVPDTKFTQLVANYLGFMGADLTSGQDTVNYLFWRDCCSNPTDTECSIQEIPEDDPVHRFSGLRCQNMTKPWTFQHVGCPLETTVPERILSELPLFDLSNIYGSTINSSLSARLNEGGLLKYEELNGKHWPPSGATGICNANRADLGETRCHDAPGTAMNGFIGINTYAIWFWRNHNYLAAQLAEYNPCWDDETIFQTARDINIAIYSQLVYYELFASIMGEEKMIQDGVLSASNDFRDNYDETIDPGMSMEFNTVLRYTHTIQEGIVRLTEPNGTIVGEFPVVELTFRTGWYAVNNQLALVTQSFFREPTAGFDQVVDPDISEIGMGKPFQRALDITTNDLAKNRYFGHAPYVDYINFCEGTNKTFTSFEDLADHIEPEMLEVLERIYEDVNDIDLQAGLWSEKKVEGGYVPKTFYCISAEYLKRSMISDRHWYERPNRPNAFTAEQLAQVRNITMAAFMCLHGDSVTEIQPKAFELISEENPLVSCSSIPTIDLSVWTDATCSASSDTTTTEETNSDADETSTTTDETTKTADETTTTTDETTTATDETTSAAEETTVTTEETTSYGEETTPTAEETTTTTEETTSTADETSSATDETTSAAEEILSAAEEITLAAEEITTAAEEITSAAEEITSTTEETTSTAEETTSTAEETTSTAEETTSYDDETTTTADKTTLATEETTSTADETTTTTDETTPVAEETTTTADETTSAAEETTSTADETTVAADEKTSAVEETTSTVDETITTADETTTATDETTSTAEETTVTAEETTSTDDETITTTDETTTAADETTKATDEATSAAEETTSAAEETTSTADETTVAAEETTSTADETNSCDDETTLTAEDTTVTAEETTTTTEETTTTAEETTTTTEKTTVTAEETVSYGEEITPTAEETTTTTEETTSTADETTSTADETTTNTDETTTATDETTSNAEETTVTAEETTSYGEETTPTAEESATTTEETTSTADKTTTTADETITATDEMTSTAKETTVTAEETTTTTEETTSTADETTTTTDETTTVTDETTSAAEETTVTAEETTSYGEETTPTTEETTSTADETTTTAEETTSAAEETTSAAEETNSAAEETTSSTEEKTSFNAEDSSSAEESTSSAEEKTSSNSKDSSSAEETTSSAEEKEQRPGLKQNIGSFFKNIFSLFG